MGRQKKKRIRSMRTKRVRRIASFVCRSLYPWDVFAFELTQALIGEPGVIEVDILYKDPL